jgi:hypothetical protein
MSNVDYQAWLRHVFDHEPSTDTDHWYWKEPDSWWQVTPADQVTLLTRLFEDPVPALSGFSDDQIAEGLEYLVNDVIAGYCEGLRNAEIPLETRLRGISAMFDLFEKLFERRCVPALSHLDEEPGNKLNVLCYMWWDIIPFHGFHSTKPIDEACQIVLCKTLQLPNIACQEAALHGLGHWVPAYAEFSRRTIDAFLATNSNLRAELVTYAEAARVGCIA